VSSRARFTGLLAAACGAALAGCGGGGGGTPAPPAAGAAVAADTAHAGRGTAGATPKVAMIHSTLPDSAGPPELRREIFRYAGGSRDPFTSLLATSSVGPMLSELRLVSITYDPRYGNSVAVVRAAHDSRPIRLHRGDTIGQLRVIQIRQFEVVFQVEEFGFERQETLTLRRPEVSR